MTVVKKRIQHSPDNAEARSRVTVNDRTANAYRKIQSVRKAVKHSYPSANIDEMLREISS